MTRHLQLALLGAILAGTATVASAHHSFASFDMNRTVTLTGTVRAFEWTNPHVWLWVDVPNPTGGVTSWGLEGAAPGELSRHGWDKHAIKPGDRITVQEHPLKSGQNGGSLGKITFADGHVLNSSSAAPGAGGAARLPGEAPPGGAGAGASPQ